jgi:hypothetical protein
MGRAEQSSSLSFIGLFSHDATHHNEVKVGHDIENETLWILFLNWFKTKGYLEH